MYETLPDTEADTEKLVQEIKARQVDMITFTSSSTVTNFFSGLEGKIDKGDFKDIIMACIGPITEKKLKEQGFSARVVAEKFTIPELVDAILAYYA